VKSGPSQPLEARGPGEQVVIPQDLVRVASRSVCLPRARLSPRRAESAARSRLSSRPRVNSAFGSPRPGQELFILSSSFIMVL